MIRVINLWKSFTPGVAGQAAVRGVGFEVQEGEIFMLLGPSGCGKTTTLRCIAGLEIPDDGEIWIGKQRVFGGDPRTVVPVYERGVGMVFQSYAIWPHLTVFKNVAYPLSYGIYRCSRREVRERVAKALSLVGLEGFEDRPAPLLSGGQQQRVALARALVYEPSVLLLDEPLSNLDAKLRSEMRTELRALMKRLKITVIHVTHDQEEALVLSDRIAVMEAGEIRQIGTPYEIYVKPDNDVVAGFIGTANLLRGCVATLAEKGGEGTIRTAVGLLACGFPASLSIGAQVTVMFRPEDVIVTDYEPGSVPNTFAGTVAEALFVGSRIQGQIAVGTSRIHCEIPKSQHLEPGQHVTIEIPGHTIRCLS